MSPKVSIVVPIYKVERYLSECVDSLISQTLTDIEIILVDDGSPDKSGEIADEYANKDSRIKVVHQENTGLGPARNSGMRVATGEYIGFVDSDDWAEPKMFERLYKVAERENADIVVSGHRDWTNGKIVRTKRHPLAGQTFNKKNDIDKIRKKLYGHALNEKEVEAFPMSVWIAIYRRSMIEKNGCTFKNVQSEDVIFNIPTYGCADIISFTGDVDYCYRKENQVSIMQSFSDGKLARYEEFLNELISLGNKENDEECLVRIQRTAIDCCRLYVGQVGNANIPIQEKIYYLDIFAKSDLIRKLWMNYPISRLPFQQKIFQRAIQSGNYRFALLLNSIRQNIKRCIKK